MDEAAGSGSESLADVSSRPLQRSLTAGESRRSHNKAIEEDFSRIMEGLHPQDFRGWTPGAPSRAPLAQISQSRRVGEATGFAGNTETPPTTPLQLAQAGGSGRAGGSRSSPAPASSSQPRDDSFAQGTPASSAYETPQPTPPQAGGSGVGDQGLGVGWLEALRPRDGRSSGHVDNLFDMEVEVPMFHSQPRSSGQVAAPQPTSIPGLWRKQSSAWAVPFAFAIWCLLIFVVPIGLLVRLEKDADVQFWLGPSLQLLLYLNAFPILAFVIQACLQRPHWPTVLVCLLIPALVLLFASNSLMGVATAKADQLQSTDCDIVASKRRLERSWEAADRLYGQCIADTLQQAPAARRLTFESAQSLFRFTDCSEYRENKQYHRDWDYLAYLEREHNCAGWCKPLQRPLWVDTASSLDRCSLAVSQVFGSKVLRAAEQAIITAMLVLAATALVLLVALQRRLGAAVLRQLSPGGQQPAPAAPPPAAAASGRY